MEGDYELPELTHGRRWKVWPGNSLVYVAIQVRHRFRWKTVFKDYTHISNGAPGVVNCAEKIMIKVRHAEQEARRRREIPFGTHYGKENDNA
jgi:hypothetical protein